MKNAAIFLSYRRQDEPGYVGRLADRLTLAFGEHSVFRDLDTIIPGSDWKLVLSEAVTNSRVVLTVIGKRWQSILLAKQDGEDYVRFELNLANRLKKPVIPILLDGSGFESNLDMGDLNWLKNLQHLEISDRQQKRWEHGVELLIKQIAELAGMQPLNRLADNKKLKRIVTTRLPKTGEFLIGRESEIDVLNEAWQNPRTNIVQIAASGGIGKTQLIKKWRESIVTKPSHGGAEFVFDWSFYSQGTQQEASSEIFFRNILKQFGEISTFTDPWEKGEHLAELIRRQRSLLILDGLEPLQHAPGPMKGELIDKSIQALLRGLGEENSGLCVVTTREPVPDLVEISEPARRTIDLSTFTPKEGAALLRIYVKDDKETLEKVSDEYGGHALALILLGTYVRDRLSGDISRIGEMISQPKVELFKGAADLSHHAEKVMASYVRWFEKEFTGQDAVIHRAAVHLLRLAGFSSRPRVRAAYARWIEKEATRKESAIYRAAVVILRLLGLFNRPAEAGCLGALRAKPIPGLTEPLFAWGDTDDLWKEAVIRLRQAHLLADSATDDGSLDAHPIVREYFARELQGRSKRSARAAHGKLYEYLTSTEVAPLEPNTSDEMMPLFHAVAHGCKAGLTKDGLEQVYWKRIQRGALFFNTRTLGDLGTELVALSHFFGGRWSRPSQELSLRKQGEVYRLSGFLLRALGRMEEAEKTMSEGMRIAWGLNDWKTTAEAATYFSSMKLMRGETAAAARLATFSIENADRSTDALWKIASRNQFANILMDMGRREAAAHVFDEIRNQKESSGLTWGGLIAYPYWQFQLNDLDLSSRFLLTIGEQAGELEPIIDEIRAEVKLSQERREQGKLKNHASGAYPLLDMAFDELILGRTYILEAVLKTLGRYDPTEALDNAAQYLASSISSFECARTEHELPRGYLHRAALGRLQVELALSGMLQEKSSTAVQAMLEHDLARAESIAKRGSMIIWQIDAAVERARLAVLLGDKPTGQAKLDEAVHLIAKTEQRYTTRIPGWPDLGLSEYPGSLKGYQVLSYHCRNDEIAYLQHCL